MPGIFCLRTTPRERSASASPRFATRDRLQRREAPKPLATIDSAVVQIVTHDGRSTFRARFDGSTGSLIVSRAPEWNCTLTNGRFERLEGLRVFVIVPAASQVIRAYCGGWSGTGSSGGDFGVLGLLIDGSTVIGVAASPSDGDKAADVVEGSYSAGGGIAISIPSYIFTGETSRYAIFGAYESTLDGRRSGSWTVGPCSF